MNTFEYEATYQSLVVWNEALYKPMTRTQVTVGGSTEGCTQITEKTVPLSMAAADKAGQTGTLALPLHLFVTPTGMKQWIHR
jgi:hypothetical protein